ncbi:hypothetical protein V5799_000004 [Amblyomma americanum]|uniref:Uncharacterized protein n=1 Tax=Amblyomma americanum TaxID=6943 RepID=A0AAQ4D4A4_AMBAM
MTARVRTRVSDWLSWRTRSTMERFHERKIETQFIYFFLVSFGKSLAISCRSHGRSPFLVIAMVAPPYHRFFRLRLFEIS